MQVQTEPVAMPWREHCEFWQSAVRSMVLDAEPPPYGFELGNHLRAEQQDDCGRFEVGSGMTTWFEARCSQSDNLSYSGAHAVTGVFADFAGA